MSNTLARLRARAYKSQFVCCYYCGAKMWTKESSGLTEELGITPESAKLFQCTAEHLQARCNGGKDRPDNIVAACLCCNQLRHRMKEALSPKRHKAMVVRAVHDRNWPTAMAIRCGQHQVG
jgi:hypothetical protein